MTARSGKDGIRDIDEAELASLARATDCLLAGRPIGMDGPLRQRQRAGSGMEFLDYQRYVPGIDLGRIDWRASARSRHLLMRRYHEDALSEWYVCLDRSASMCVPSGSKWTRAAQVAVAILFLLLHRTDRVGLLTFSTDVDMMCPLGRGHAQYRRAVSCLAASQCRTEGGASNVAACAKWVGRGRSAFVISDFLAPDGMQAGLKGLLRLGGKVHAVQILDREECVVPSAPWTLLRDIESGQRLTIRTNGDMVESAERTLGRLRSDLALYCRRNGIEFTFCTADKSWKAIVTEHLKGLGAGYA